MVLVPETVADGSESCETGGVEEVSRAMPRSPKVARRRERAVSVGATAMEAIVKRRRAKRAGAVRSGARRPNVRATMCREDVSLKD